MDLIDRQEAIKAIDDVLMEDDRYKVWLKLGINNLKPVDAIPIEWISNKAKAYEQSDNLLLQEGAFPLNILIDTWKEEQET